MNTSGSKPRILVVDDTPRTVEVIERNLSSRGYEVFRAGDVARAIELLDQTPVDLVITDLKMPRVGGMTLVRHVRENLKNTEIVMMTGFASVGTAVEAVKAGAEDYLAKPFTDEELLAVVERALEKLRLRRAVQRDSPEPVRPHGLIGESEAMREVFRGIAKAASTKATVLITGESGTGKELVARAIHYGSARRTAPFVPVNCGGIPEGLIESELFGHARGAFTGATETRAGLFQTADGGTIFLDEIGEIGPSMQVKLLRVLQEKEVFMLGSRRPRKVDVRILAASNKDLQALVKKGTLREDLFFRINVLPLEIPPLRKRGDDLLLLARHFASQFARELEKPAPRFTDDALRALRNYDWPGNVRELENVIQRLVVMLEEDVVDVPDLPSAMRFLAPRGSGPYRTLAEVEAEHIQTVLAAVHDNKTRAAEILGIDRKTLRDKITRGLTTTSS
ncbi:MAG TPA: sigma-54 dependent transcriptional regulator [Vicinamibacteria bacterium]